jgi:hypothetical protein
MTTYNVHIYREMRLVYGGVEADSHEAAAAIARDKPTDQADSIDDCEGRSFSALVDVLGDEDYEQSEVIDFEEERQHQAAPKLLGALKAFIDADAMAEECQEWKWENLDHAFKLAHGAAAEAEAAGMASSPPSASDPAKKPYSVLLFYPDHVNDDGTETYYAWVEAPDPIAAVAEARRQALAANEWTEEDVDPDDFAPLLVIEGHHYGQPMTND